MHFYVGKIYVDIMEYVCTNLSPTNNIIKFMFLRTKGPRLPYCDISIYLLKMHGISKSDINHSKSNIIHKKINIISDKKTQT